MIQLTRDKTRLESSVEKAEEKMASLKREQESYVEQMNQQQTATQERLTKIEEENEKLLETIRQQIGTGLEIQIYILSKSKFKALKR